MNFLRSFVRAALKPRANDAERNEEAAPKTYLYREGGFIVRVEVLADNSDSEWERLTLRCTEVVQYSDSFRAPEVGSVWEASRTRGPGGAYAGWYLKDYEPAGGREAKP